MAIERDSAAEGERDWLGAGERCGDGFTCKFSGLIIPAQRDVRWDERVLDGIEHAADGFDGRRLMFGNVEAELAPDGQRYRPNF